jgi:hypothetical protein
MRYHYEHNSTFLVETCPLVCFFVHIGYTTNTPEYSKENKPFKSRSDKDKKLKKDSSQFSRGLHESWEWYDKCNKRKRNVGMRLEG